jgi:hypothetical protein
MDAELLELTKIHILKILFRIRVDPELDLDLTILKEKRYYYCKLQTLDYLKMLKLVICNLNMSTVLTVPYFFS